MTKFRYKGVDCYYELDKREYLIELYIMLPDKLFSFFGYTKQLNNRGVEIILRTKINNYRKDSIITDELDYISANDWFHIKHVI